MSPGSFKNNETYTILLQMIYMINMHKRDLVLNDLQWLIFHKTYPINQTTLLPTIFGFPPYIVIICVKVECNFFLKANSSKFYHTQVSAVPMVYDGT